MPPLDNDPKKGVTPARIGIWIVVGAIGGYMLISGVIGILGGGA